MQIEIVCWFSMVKEEDKVLVNGVVVFWGDHFIRMPKLRRLK